MSFRKHQPWKDEAQHQAMHRPSWVPAWWRVVGSSQGQGQPVDASCPVQGTVRASA